MTLIKHFDFEIPDWAEFQQGPQIYTALVPQTDAYRDLELATTPTNLVGYFRLGEASGITANNSAPTDVADRFGDAIYSPNANNIWTGGGTQGVTGLITQADLATRFDAGVFGGVTIPNTEGYSPDRFTIAAWVKPETFIVNQTRPILMQRGPSASNWFLYSDGYTQHRFTFSVTQPDGTAKFFPWTTTLTSGQTYFLTAVVRSQSVSLYVNGSLVSSGTITGIRDAPQHPITIGGIPPGVSRGFGGVIDEVTIRSTDLSASQIASLYQQGVAA